MKTIKVDLHNHFTTKSKVLDVNRVADRVREALGEGGICSLVNYDDRRFEAFAERTEPYGNRLGNAVYFPDRKVTIIKGEEVPTLQGDLLVLGLEEGRHLTPRKELSWSLCESSDNDGIIIIPHPYFHSKVGPTLEKNPENLKSIHAIETRNGNASIRANDMADHLWYNTTAVGKFGKYSGRVGWLCNSDGHSFREVGSSYTKVEGFEFSDARSLNCRLREAIKVYPIYFRSIRSYRVSFTHSAIIGTSILASKFRIPWSRGDKEALR